VSESFWLDEARDVGGRWTISSDESYTHATTIIRGAGHGRAIDTKAIDTKAIHAPNGTYSRERSIMHQAIISHLLGRSKPQASPEAVFTAGGAASGKSALAGKASEAMRNMPTPKNHVYINADDIKKMLPEYTALGELGKGELAAPATHEESSDIAKVLTAIAIKQKRHVVIDGTGNSEVGKFGDKLRAAKANGYRVTARYAHVPTETALERERARATRTGRKVPEDVVRKQHRVVSQSYEQDVRHMDGVHIQIVSTAGRGRPTMIAEKQSRGQMQVLNGPKYREMLNKANQ
jgi:predicted ABC-type ATPase